MANFETPVIAVDSLKDADNVLILFPDCVTVATVPPSEATRLATHGLGGHFDHEHWDIPLAKIRELKGAPGGLEITYDGPGSRPAKLHHLADGPTVAAFLERLPRSTGGIWDRETGRESPLGPLAVFWGAGLVCAGVTALFYFGIQGGWINTAPSFIAMIHNILGLYGILAVGGLATAACFFGGFKAIVAPGEVIYLRKRT